MTTEPTEVLTLVPFESLTQLEEVIGCLDLTVFSDVGLWTGTTPACVDFGKVQKIEEVCQGQQKDLSYRQNVSLQE